MTFREEFCDKMPLQIRWGRNGDYLSNSLRTTWKKKIHALLHQNIWEIKDLKINKLLKYERMILYCQKYEIFPYVGHEAPETIFKN